MPTPTWVATSLADILGLDTETIREVIVPDLEGYTSEVRLRGHLQDFLGTTAPARAFADQYVAYRFPSIAPPPSAAALAPNPDLAKPKAVKGKGVKKAATSLSASASASAAASASSSRAPTPLGASVPLGGTVYQKHTDESLSRGGSGVGAHRSETPVRRGGAITIMEKKSKGKDRAEPAPPKEDKIWDVPKSKEVLRLEGVVAALRGVQGGGKAVVSDKPCFCQARVHALATYTPQCAACGLVLCDRQAAYAPCPSCARPTLAPPALARLVQRVEGDIAAQLSHEADEREEAERVRKERLLARSGGGAFPSLPGGAGGAAGKASSADVTRRVLTIGKPKGKGKPKATLTTTTYTSAPAPSSSATVEEVDDTIPRPRSPPLDTARVSKELAKALAYRAEHDRPWADPKAERAGEVWEYIPPLVIVLPGEEGTGRRRKAKKEKGVGLDGRIVVGAR